MSIPPGLNSSCTPDGTGVRIRTHVSGASQKKSMKFNSRIPCNTLAGSLTRHTPPEPSMNSPRATQLPARALSPEHAPVPQINKHTLPVHVNSRNYLHPHRARIFPLTLTLFFAHALLSLPIDIRTLT